MKKLFLFSLTLTIVMRSYAQPVYKSINRMQTPYITNALDTTGVKPGPSGANQVWDFSKTIALNKTNEVKYVAASTCPGAGNFPSADIALPTGSERYIFYDTANGKW